MPDPILGAPAPSPEIYTRIGKVASEWGWVESLLAEMLAHFCTADHGAMYVITQNVANATVTGWLRTLTEMLVKDPNGSQVILDLLAEVDDTRAERNVVVHGLWRAHDDLTCAWVQTMKWDRSEVARDELWSCGDLDDLVAQITRLQLMIANLGVRMGFLHMHTP